MEQKTQFSKIKNITTGVLFAFLLTFSFIIPLQPQSISHSDNMTTQNRAEEKGVVSSIPNLENFFSDLVIAADSAFVWDMKNQRILFEKKANKVAPLASITKMIAAVITLELAPANTEIRIQREFLEAEGDSGLYVDERWLLKDLLDFSLVSSSNDGFRAIASVVGAISAGTDDPRKGRQKFIEKINQKAQELNLENTVVYDETGLDQNKSQSGAYSTAKETALFFQYILREHPEILEPTDNKELSFISLSNKHHTATNTNLIAKKVPGMIGAKTGYTDLAGGNLVTVFDSGLGQPIIIVVLGSSIEERFTDTEKLIGAARSFIIEEKNSSW